MVNENEVLLSLQRELKCAQQGARYELANGEINTAVHLQRRAHEIQRSIAEARIRLFEQKTQHHSFELTAYSPLARANGCQVADATS